MYFEVIIIILLVLRKSHFHILRSTVRIDLIDSHFLFDKLKDKIALLGSLFGFHVVFLLKAAPQQLVLAFRSNPASSSIQYCSCFFHHCSSSLLFYYAEPKPRGQITGFLSLAAGFIEGSIPPPFSACFHHRNGAPDSAANARGGFCGVAYLAWV